MTWRPLPTPRADREPRRVADSLDRIAASIGAPRPSLLSAVFARWDELVGPDVAAHATPRSLRDGVLTVVVDHPAWATSLRLLSADLLRRIAPHGGGVTELVVRVGLPGDPRPASESRPARRRGNAPPAEGPGGRGGDGDGLASGREGGPKGRGRGDGATASARRGDAMPSDRGGDTAARPRGGRGGRVPDETPGRAPGGDHRRRGR